MGVLEMECSRF